jgi:hypothetical protein
MHVAEVAGGAIAKPAMLGCHARNTRLAGSVGVGHHREVTMTRFTPSRHELLVGLVLAPGILAIVIALRIVPPPWRALPR